MTKKKKDEKYAELTLDGHFYVESNDSSPAEKPETITVRVFSEDEMQNIWNITEEIIEEQKTAGA